MRGMPIGRPMPRMRKPPPPRKPPPLNPPPSSSSARAEVMRKVSGIIPFDAAISAAMTAMPAKQIPLNRDVEFLFEFRGF